MRVTSSNIKWIEEFSGVLPLNPVECEDIYLIYVKSGWQDGELGQ
jgi:hypothetical protein